MLEKIVLPETKRTPYVNFDATNGVIELRCHSTPENPYDFYKPLLLWVDEYCRCPNIKTIVNLKLEYINSSSSKLILTLLKKFETLPMNNYDAVINWYCEEDDWDMIEAAELYKSLVKIPFEIVTMV
jgi:hypothetical protein